MALFVNRTCRIMESLLILLATVAGYSHQVFNNFNYGPGNPGSLQVPNFVSKNESFSAKIDSDVTFTCKVDRRDDSFKMIFMYISQNGEDRIMYAGNISVAHHPRIHKLGARFVLEKIRETDAGQYVCRFETNPVKSLVNMLDVQYPPQIQRHGAEVQKVLKWSTVTLKCSAEGHPTPTVTWYRNEGPLASNTYSIQDDSIIFQRVERSEEGTYVCTANNGVGDPASSSVRLLVEYQPEVRTKQSSRYTADGAEAQLTCIVHGRPKPSLSWLRGDSVVSSQKHVMTHDGGARHTLTISGVSPDDFGDYSCKARNIHGITIKNLRLNGLPLKPVVISNKEGQLDDIYVLVWETESLAPVMQYRIILWKGPLISQDKHSRPLQDWLFTPDNDTFEEMYSRHTAGRFRMRHVFENLHPSEDYVTVIRVENRYGWSPESPRFSFTTKRRVSLGLSTSSAHQYGCIQVSQILMVYFTLFFVR